MALSCVVSEIFSVEKCRDLEIWVRGHSKSLKVVPFGHSVYGFLLVFFSNFVPKTHCFWYIWLVYTLTFKPGLGVTEGNRKWYHSIRHPWIPINVP